MTFYNLPETDVKIEFDTKAKVLRVLNLPEGYVLGEWTDDQGNGVTITWKKPGGAWKGPGK